MIVTIEGGRLVRRYDAEILVIEAWGVDGIRVRATERGELDEREDWALAKQERDFAATAIEAKGDSGRISNGAITAELREGGRIEFLNSRGEIVLEERMRVRGPGKKYFDACEVRAREYKPIVGGMYRITQRFEATEGEKLFGMGQYQDGRLDLKGSILELAQRNSQVSVPFLLSSRGYGLLWNNPAVGRASFAANMTEFVAETSGQIDYWVTVGDNPAVVEENYAAVSGTVPMMPEWAMGFWQCKLRYKTQEELLEVAREYKRRGLPLSAIVCDFFHWPHLGDWAFDERYWPDPEAMTAELEKLGVKLVVSIWPNVEKGSERYKEMLERGLLVRTERGIRMTMEFGGDSVFYDATNPEAREYIWKAAKTNYYDKGVASFWLDEAEPEFSGYDFEHFRYKAGSVMEVGNVYPLRHAQAFYEGMRASGEKDVLNLLRCAWAGSQRYGALVWSGDIDTSFESFRHQFAAGLNMGLAGIPWWTTDIGGFEGGDPDDPAYRELLVRWFEWGTFCPVFRLHGFRKGEPAPGGDGPGSMFSGGPNEVWSYGDEAYSVLTAHMRMRERLRPYIREQMLAAHERGAPVMRPAFYDFPEDGRAWELSDQYMFGPALLVAPVMQAGMRRRSVYLPSGAKWRDLRSGQEHEGGGIVIAEAPLSSIPVFAREGSELYRITLE
jgi:Alpha-glucosidases, family 31 of glycosyl hydrolases